MNSQMLLHLCRFFSDMCNLFCLPLLRAPLLWKSYMQHVAIFTAYVAFATLVRFILFLRMSVTWGLFKPAMSSSSLGRDLVSQLLSSVPLGNLNRSWDAWNGYPFYQDCLLKVIPLLQEGGTQHSGCLQPVNFFKTQFVKGNIYNLTKKTIRTVLV